MIKLIHVVMFFLLTACNTLPQLYQAAEDIATDDAITIRVDKDAFQRETDVNVYVEVKNKDKS